MLLQPPLSREQKERVYDRIRRGDDSARLEIVWSHGHLFRKVAAGYRRFYDLETHMFDDLVQVCFERAMKVVHRFDPDIAEFATFITSWLRPAIDDYVSQSLQIPVQLLKNRRKIARAIRLQQERGIIPTPASVRAEYGYSKTHVAAVLEGRGMFSALQSISEPIGNGLDGDAQSLEDLLESDEKPVLEHIASTEAVSLLNQAMATLTERDHFVIESRAFKGLTLWQVGELLEVTPERARQIEVKAKQKLRTYLEDRGLTHDALF